MPKLLSVVWYKVLPAKFGGQKGIALFNKHLSKHHPLVCIYSKNNEPQVELSYKLLPLLPVGKSQFIDPRTWLTIYRIAKREKVSHLILEHAYHGISGWLCKILLGVKIIVHSHNIEHERFRLQGKWWWPLLKQFERWTHRQADLSFFKTEADKASAVTHFGLTKETCMIVPYGVEQPVSQWSKTEAKKLVSQRHNFTLHDKLLLFAGTLDYAPNAQGVEDIYNHIAPALPPGYTIIICGRNQLKKFNYLRELQHPQVINAGEVDDIEMYYSAADVFINPLPGSSGIQTKTIDALSFGLNVVCFAGNVEGLPMNILNNKCFVAINNDWQDFVRQITFAATSSQVVPGEFYRQYRWETITRDVAARISRL